jgi:phosphohistidine phosphatase SixA
MDNATQAGIGTAFNLHPRLLLRDENRPLEEEGLQQELRWGNWLKRR